MKREYPERPIVAVGAAVCHNEQVLIVQRGKAPSMGVWTVPGGAVDLGETMRQAAAREVKEECNIKVEIGEVVGILDNVVYDEQGQVRYHYAIVDFAARYIGGELCPNDELMDAAWIMPSEFDAYSVPAKAREILLNALGLYCEEQQLKPNP
jgi:ADP-ribose pyrophosphatase YjhB (NUDIX family)